MCGLKTPAIRPTTVYIFIVIAIAIFVIVIIIQLLLLLLLLLHCYCILYCYCYCHVPCSKTFVPLYFSNSWSIFIGRKICVMQEYSFS